MVRGCMPLSCAPALAATASRQIVSVHVTILMCFLYYANPPTTSPPLAQYELLQATAGRTRVAGTRQSTKPLPSSSAARPSGCVPSMKYFSDPSFALPMRIPFFQPGLRTGFIASSASGAPTIGRLDSESDTTSVSSRRIQMPLGAPEMTPFVDDVHVAVKDLNSNRSTGRLQTAGRASRTPTRAVPGTRPASCRCGRIASRTFRPA